MKFNFKNIDKKWKEYALAGSVCVVLFVLLTNLGKVASAIASFLSIFSSVFIGLIIAYIINPLTVWFDSKVFKNIKKRKSSWILSVILSIVLVLVFLAFMLYLLIPQTVSSASSLFDNMGDYITSLEDAAHSINGSFGSIAVSIADKIAGRSDLISQLYSLISDNMGNVIEKTTTFGSKAVNMLIGAVLAVYFLFAKESILKTFGNLFRLLLSPASFMRSKIFVEKFNSIFSTYIVCELLDSLIIGVINFIAMLIMGMPDVALISVVVAITNLIPTFGPLIGAVFGTFILLLLKPSAVIPFLILTAVLQTFDAYFIKPKLFGNALSVPGALILVAIIVFGKLMGVIGMLISIPCAAIIVFLYDEILIPSLELKRDLKQFKNKSSTDKT